MLDKNRVDGHCEQDHVLDEERGDGQHKEDAQCAAVGNPAEVRAVGWCVIRKQGRDIEHNPNGDDERRQNPGVERVEAEGPVPATRPMHLSGEGATNVVAHDVHPEKGR